MFSASRTLPDRTTVTAVGAVAVGAALALTVWAAWLRPRRVVVRPCALELPGWPRALDGLRVAVIADLHTGAPHVGTEKVAEIVARVNEQAPDLVVLLGDYVDPELPLGEHVRPEAVADELGGLAAPLGTLAVLGNHDVDYDAGRVRAALQAAGATVLENDAAILERGGTRLAVVGVAERDSDEPTGPPPELPKAAQRDAVLVLTHSPDAFPRVPAEVSLTVAGHTHGGQIDVPGLRERAIPSRFGSRFKGGLVVEGDRHLFVSAGIGTSRLPLRLGAPPEVPILELRSRDGGS